MSEDRDEMTLELARSIAQKVSHRKDGTSKAMAMLDAEIERLTNNESAVKVWMNGIDDILGCEFEIDKASHSGKVGYKCRICYHYSNAPVRGSASPCREKVRAARAAGGTGGVEATA